MRDEHLEEIEEKFWDIVNRASDRGRDSFGLVALNRDGSVTSHRNLGRPIRRHVFEKGISLVIANNRAEPTTEAVKEKKEQDIQPFEGERFVVSHNGIIANDREIERRYGLSRKSSIDSAVIPPLLDSRWDGKGENLGEVLKDVVGSFALAVADKRNPTRVTLAQNFKPMYMAYDFGRGAVFFSSLDEYLNFSPKDKVNQRRLKPYSVFQMDSSGEMMEWSIEPPIRKRAMVVASGGLDSTVAATKLVREGYEVALLHFKYKHKAEEREEKAIRSIADYLNAELIEMETDVFRTIGKSTLLKGEGEINKTRGGESGAEFAHEWVPARNLVFISVAVAMAEAWGYDFVATGVNLEESGAYPDNEMEFIRLLDAVMPYATGPNRRVRLIMPVGNLVKHEIVKLGLTLDAPLGLTWSCYEGGDRHCGRCGPCYMRRKAFEMNGVKDPVEYAELTA